MQRSTVALLTIFLTLLPTCIDGRDVCRLSQPLIDAFPIPSPSFDDLRLRGSSELLSGDETEDLTIELALLQRGGTSKQDRTALVAWLACPVRLAVRLVRRLWHRMVKQARS